MKFKLIGDLSSILNLEISASITKPL